MSPIAFIKSNGVRVDLNVKKPISDFEKFILPDISSPAVIKKNKKISVLEQISKKREAGKRLEQYTQSI